MICGLTSIFFVRVFQPQTNTCNTDSQGNNFSIFGAAGVEPWPGGFEDADAAPSVVQQVQLVKTDGDGTSSADGDAE